MTSQQILEQAIQKAIDGGWKPYNRKRDEIEIEYKAGAVFNVLMWIQQDGDSPFRYIFNHDFARSLWGSQTWWVALPGQSGEKRVEVEIPAWQMHLQAMVTAEDPIKYLGEHLPR